MTIAKDFVPDSRGVLSPYRINTPCCGGVCLTNKEYRDQRAKRIPWECPLHGSRTGEAIFDEEWMRLFSEIGVKQKKADADFSKEVNRRR